MEEIEIGFSRLPMGFDVENNFIYNSLKKKYRIKLSPSPEFLFYSSFQGEISEKSRVKTFFTGENRRPNMSVCDWAFSFDYDESVGDSRHMRLPLFLLSATGMEHFRFELPDILKSKTVDIAKSFTEFKKRDFCVYIAQHPGSLRAEAFDILSAYKPVNAPGKSKNNAAPIDNVDALESRLDKAWQAKKIHHMRRFKFSLVFENNAWPGYTTEKIIDAMAAGCIPIYWGNPNIETDFNIKSFVNVTPFTDSALEQLPKILDYFPARVYTWQKKRLLLKGLYQGLNQVKDIDQNEQKLFEMYCEKWVSEDQLSTVFDFEKYEQRLFEIIES